MATLIMNIAAEERRKNSGDASAGTALPGNLNRDKPAPTSPKLTRHFQWINSIDGQFGGYALASNSERSTIVVDNLTVEVDFTVGDSDSSQVVARGLKGRKYEARQRIAVDFKRMGRREYLQAPH